METCILCKSSIKDDVKYGDFMKNDHFGVHMFCLYLSSNLSQNGEDDEGFLGFLEVDIRKEVNRVSLLKCCYCHKMCANIGCCNRKCRRTFHLICGIEHNAQFQFCHDFQSFCYTHATKEKRRPSSNENCLICYDRLCPAGKNSNKVNFILTPCCRNGWFHKLCLQKFAKTAGYFFKCPLCNDSKTFREKLPAQGIFIPNQDAAWELEPNAFAELLERPNECGAQICKHKQGRKACSDNNPFVMCSTCGSTAMHRKCLANGVKLFHCADCTVALEEGDSGQESINSRVNHNDIECEDVDVCHVSDKEDFQIIERLIETNNKRDSGTQQDSSDDEIIHTTKKCNKIRRIRESIEENTLNFDNVTQKRNSKMDSENSILTHESKIMNKRARSDTESSKDTLEDEDFLPHVSKTNKKTRIESDKDSNNDTLSQEYLPHGPRSKKRIRSDNLEDEDSPEVSRSDGIINTIQNSKKIRIRESIKDNSDNVCNGAIKPTTVTQKRNLRVDSEESVSPHRSSEKTRFGSDSEGCKDLPYVTRRTKKARIRSDTESSKDTLEEDIHHGLGNIKTRFRIDSESSKDTIIESQEMEARRLNSVSESEETDEPNKHKFRIIKSSNIFGDSDSEEEGNVKSSETQSRNKENEISLHSCEDKFVFSPRKRALNSSKEKHLDGKSCKIKTKINNNSRSLITFTDESDSDDPLENFTKAMEKQKNISCIALRTRRSLHLNNSQGRIKNKKSEENKAKLCAPVTKQAEDELLLKERTRSRGFFGLKSPQDSGKKGNYLDISCIAKRTRRKTYCSSNSNVENKRKENPLNTSCIALRTRRKTICAETNYSQESLCEMSQIYEKVHESDDNYEISTDDDSESKFDSDFNSESDFEIDDGFEISCIANRTRKRKILKANISKLPKIIEIDCSSEISDSSNLYNNNLSKRCNRHLSTHSNEEIITTVPSTSNLKTKQIATSLWLTKLPQRNYTAFLTPKGSSYSNTR